MIIWLTLNRKRRNYNYGTWLWYKLFQLCFKQLAKQPARRTSETLTGRYSRIQYSGTSCLQSMPTLSVNKPLCSEPIRINDDSFTLSTESWESLWVPATRFFFQLVHYFKRGKGSGQWMASRSICIRFHQWPTRIRWYHILISVISYLFSKIAQMKLPGIFW